MSDWHDVRDPQSAELDELARQYKLHPLHIEDCRHRNQNAKVEFEHPYLFVVLKLITIDEDTCVQAGDLDLFLGPDWLITVQEMNCAPLTNVMQRVRQYSAGLRADQIFYRILDGVVDSYYPLLDTVTERIDKMEDEALTCPDPPLLERLFDMRRSLIELRRMFANTRDLVGHLLRDETPQIRPDLTPFLRDVYDHVVRGLDNIEIQRDLVTGTMELYLSAIANRTNQIMKVLTVFGTVATPALVITGMYGMNLQHLPFADHPHSFGIVMSIIAGVSIVMLVLLRRVRWL